MPDHRKTAIAPGQAGPDSLLVMNFGRLGDLLQSLPAIRRLKSGRPQRTVTVLAVREMSDLLTDVPDIDRLVRLPFADFKPMLLSTREEPGDLPRRLAEYPELREVYDLAVNLSHEPGSLRVFDTVRAARLLGCAPAPPGEVRARGAWARWLFASAADRRVNAFNLADIYTGLAEAPFVEVGNTLSVPRPLRERAEQLLAGLGLRRDRPLVAMNLGTNDPARGWPVENYAAVADSLGETAEVVILGAPTDRKRAEGFLASVRRPVADAVGKTAVRDLPGLCAAASVLISGDTGTAHIAAAVSTPVTVLSLHTAFGPETGPYGAGHTVLQAACPCAPCLPGNDCRSRRCFDRVTVKAVLESARQVLNPGVCPPSEHTELDVYHSRFQANGLLAYEPRPELPLPPRFAESLYLRRAWERAVGLEPDAEALSRFGPGIRRQKEFPAFQAQWEAGRQAWLMAMERCVREAERVAQLTRKAAEDSSQLLNALNQLTDAVEGVRFIEAAPKIWREFFHYSCMDGEAVEHPALAEEMAEAARESARLAALGEAFPRRL